MFTVMITGWGVPLAWVGRSVVGTAAEIGRFGQFTARAARAATDVTTWGGLVFAQMARLGVASLSIALFIYEYMRPRVTFLSLHPDGSYRDAERWKLARCRHVGKAKLSTWNDHGRSIPRQEL